MNKQLMCCSDHADLGLKPHPTEPQRVRVVYRRTPEMIEEMARRNRKYELDRKQYRVRKPHVSREEIEAGENTKRTY